VRCFLHTQFTGKWTGIKYAVYTSPLATILLEYVKWIKAAVTSVTPDFPSEMWTELEHRYLSHYK